MLNICPTWEGQKNAYFFLSNLKKIGVAWLCWFIKLVYGLK